MVDNSLNPQGAEALELRSLTVMPQTMGDNMQLLAPGNEQSNILLIVHYLR